MNPNASRAALVYAAAGLLLLGAAIAEPWFWAERSSGRQTPPQGLQPPTDTGVQRQTLRDQPPATSGDYPVADTAGHAQWLRITAWTTWASAGFLLLVVLGEVPGIRRLVPRGVSLTASALAVLCGAAALVVAWFLTPATVGIGAGPYQSVLRDGWYLRSSLDWGYYLAALGTPMGVASFLAKYQAGWQEASAIERHILPAR